MSVAVQATTSAVRAAEAAALLYEEHSERILAFCARRLRSREEAEDAAQQTFLKAFAAMRGGFRPTVERAWLYRIAENVCADRLRANGRRVRHEARDADAVLEVLPARPAEPIEGLEGALAALTPQQRHAFLLREWQGLSYREIAAELHLSHSAVETLLFRARRSLARRLEALPLIPWLKSTLFGGGAGAKAAAAVAVTVGVGAAAVAPIVADRPPSEPTPLSKPDAPLVAPERARQAPAPATRPAARRAERRVAPTVGAVVDTPARAEANPTSPGASVSSPVPSSPRASARAAEQAPAPPPTHVAPVTPEAKLPDVTLPEPPVELPPLPLPNVEVPPIEPPAILEPVLKPVQPLLEPVQNAVSELPALP